MNGGESGSIAPAGVPICWKKPLEASARDGHHPGHLLDPIGVQQTRRNEAEAALLEQPRLLLAVEQMDEHPNFCRPG